MRYFFDSRVRYSEIGPDNKLTLLSILDYFQDCSTFHAESVGRGIDVLRAEKTAWLLSSWQIVIERYPELGEKIRIWTWPYSMRSFFGDRNYLMTDETGSRVAYANSLWVFTDMEAERAIRVPQREIDAFVYADKLDMEYAPRKIAVSGEGRTAEQIRVMKHHIDTNDHMNNGRYVMVAEEYLPDGFVIRQMRAEYKNAAHLDDVIVPVVYEDADGGRCTVSLNSEEGKPYCIVEFLRAK